MKIRFSLALNIALTLALTLALMAAIVYIGMLHFFTLNYYKVFTGQILQAAAFRIQEGESELVRKIFEAAPHRPEMEDIGAIRRALNENSSPAPEPQSRGSTPVK